MRVWDDEGLINVGSGDEATIAELAELIADVVGWSGRLVFDTSKPDGTPRKLVDFSRLSALGWKPSIGLREGMAQVYSDFRRRWEAGTIAAAG